MADMSAIAGAVTAFNGLKTLAQAIVALRDKRLTQEVILEFQERLIDLQGKLMTVQQEHAALIQRERDLEREVADLKAWAAEDERYELADMGGGNFAYLEKPAMRGGRPPHYLCAACYAERKKSVLQAFRTPGGFHVITCPTCKTKLPVNDYRPPA